MSEKVKQACNCFEPWVPLMSMSWIVRQLGLVLCSPSDPSVSRQHEANTSRLDANPSPHSFQCIFADLLVQSSKLPSAMHPPGGMKNYLALRTLPCSFSKVQKNKFVRRFVEKVREKRFGKATAAVSRLPPQPPPPPSLAFRVANGMLPWRHVPCDLCTTSDL